MSRKKENPPENYYEVFPSRLRLLMKESGTTHEKLAKALDKTRQAIGYYQDGSSTPDWKTLKAIAVYFDVSADFLLGLSDSRSTSASVQQIHRETGLSEKAVQKIIQVSKEDGYAPLFSALLESPCFMDALHSIYSALWCKKSAFQRVNETRKLRNDLVEVANIAADEIVHNNLIACSRLSREFVLVRRETQSISFLQQAESEFGIAARMAIKNVEDNKSMDNLLLEVALKEMEAVEDILQDDSISSDAEGIIDGFRQVIERSEEKQTDTV